MDYPKELEITGVFFRGYRNGKWESVDLCDLTREELHEILKEKPAIYLLSVIEVLQQTLRAAAEGVGMVSSNGYEIYSPKPKIMSDEDWVRTFAHFDRRGTLSAMCTRIREIVREEMEKSK